MKFVFVPYCLQIFLHRRNGERLLRFFDLIVSLVKEIKIEYPNRKLNESDLQDCNLLISTTRRKICPYNACEINLITDYVQSGGAMLVMSNHPPLFPTRDSELSEKLGFRFQEACFKPLPGEDLFIISDFKPPAHSILSHPKVTGRTLKVAVKNCSCIEPNGEFGTPLLLINRSNCIVSGNYEVADKPIFAIAIDGGENKGLGEAHGRIIGISDSGIIGKPTRNNPGPGLCAGDNYYFMQNVLKWLLDI